MALQLEMQLCHLLSRYCLKLAPSNFRLCAIRHSVSSVSHSCGCGKLNVFLFGATLHRKSRSRIDLIAEPQAIRAIAYTSIFLKGAITRTIRACIYGSRIVWIYCNAGSCAEAYFEHSERFDWSFLLLVDFVVPNNLLSKFVSHLTISIIINVIFIFHDI